MEKLINNIVANMASELNLNKENEEVIAYGMFAAVHTLLSIMLVIIFGLIFGVTIEALIISFTISILRKYSGGVHASSPSICATIGTMVCIGQALLILCLIAPLASPKLICILGVLTFIWSYYLVYKLAPVDSPSKPINSKIKKARMKKGSIMILGVYIVLVGINILMYNYLKEKRFLTYSLCIYGGVAWQVFTLTKTGHKTVKSIDSFFSKVSNIKKGCE